MLAGDVIIRGWEAAFASTWLTKSVAGLLCMSQTVLGLHREAQAWPDTSVALPPAWLRWWCLLRVTMSLPEMPVSALNSKCRGTWEMCPGGWEQRVPSPLVKKWRVPLWEDSAWFDVGESTFIPDLWDRKTHLYSKCRKTRAFDLDLKAVTCLLALPFQHIHSFKGAEAYFFEIPAYTEDRPAETPASWDRATTEFLGLHS